MLNFVICFSIVSGGLGFLVLSTTAIMIFSGTVLVMIMEWNNTLAHLSRQSRILAAFFQSVTAGTTGINALPIGHYIHVSREKEI